MQDGRVAFDEDFVDTPFTVSPADGSDDVEAAG
jgi:hypothetical protein